MILRIFIKQDSTQELQYCTGGHLYGKKTWSPVPVEHESDADKEDAKHDYLRCREALFRSKAGI